MRKKIKPHKAIIHLNASEEFKNNPESMKMLNKMVEIAYKTPLNVMKNKILKFTKGLGLTIKEYCSSKSDMGCTAIKLEFTNGKKFEYEFFGSFKNNENQFQAQLIKEI